MRFGRELTKTDQIAGGSQEIHRRDPAKLEALVHLADLKLESIEVMIADRRSVAMELYGRRDSRIRMTATSSVSSQISFAPVSSVS